MIVSKQGLSQKAVTAGLSLREKTEEKKYKGAVEFYFLNQALDSIYRQSNLR